MQHLQSVICFGLRDTLQERSDKNTAREKEEKRRRSENECYVWINREEEGESKAVESKLEKERMGRANVF